MHSALITTLIALSFYFVGAQTSANPNLKTSGSLLGDARLIITSKKNDVRLWAHAPRLLVFGDAVVEKHIRQIVNQVERAFDKPPFGSSFFGEVRFESLPSKFGEGQQKLIVGVRTGGPSGWNVHLRFDENTSYETDIVVIVADRPKIALMNGLWGMYSGYNRAILEGGPGRCFYSLRSRYGIRLGALVSIFPNGNPDMLEQCLWEELLHTLGPLQDAIKSPFFSFDNQADNSPAVIISQENLSTQHKRANDLLLIRALYESGVRPGGSPDIVIDYLRKLVDD